MPKWTSVDSAAGAPKDIVIQTGNPINSTPFYANAVYANATLGAFVNNAVVGIYGVSVSEAQSVGKGVSPGWVKKTSYTGPVVSLTVANAGASYTNAHLVKVSGGIANGAGTLTTNASGAIISVTLTDGGRGFINASNTTVTITNATGGTAAGTGGIVTATLGGKAGRVSYENLVSFAGNITSGTGSTLT